jgi:hypothetical protein
MKTIKGSINVDKIDKARLFDGKKGRYLDIVLVPTPNGKYHDYMIVQETSKDEESIILGNAGKKFEGPQIDATGQEDLDNQPF